MRQIVFIFLFLVVTSCNYFDVKKTSSEAILIEELKTFTWNEIDEYPSFSICDNSETKEDKQLCFKNTLIQAIMSNIQTDTIVVSEDINDTLKIKFEISEKGILTLQDFDVDSLTLKEIPNIRNLINSSLDSLPPIFPAVKRGQQVNTEFTLPVIIRAN